MVLFLLAGIASAAPDPAPAPFDAIARPLRHRLTETAPVRVVLEVSSPDVAAAAARIPGVDVEHAVRGLVQLTAPGTALDDLAALPGVHQVRLPFEAIEAVESEGVDTLFLSDWSTRGLTGAGVKVAVIDTGFEDYTTLLGSELPASVGFTCLRSGAPNCDTSTHGTSVAEIVHDIAPGADLHFYGASTTSEFIAALEAIETAGDVDVVTCSIGYGNWYPADGDNVVASAVDDLVTATDVLFFQAAGNMNTAYWVGTLADSDSDGWLEMPRGGTADDDEWLQVFTDSNDSVSVDVRWDEEWGSAATDIDLEIADYLSQPCSPPVYDGHDPQDGDDDPWERIECTVQPGGAWLRLQESGGNAVGKRVWIASWYNIPQAEWTNTRSIFVPADAREAIAVGGVDWDSELIKVYSGRGPTDDGRIKPDFAAPAYVTVAVLGPGLFGGTSSATPHLAGVAALIKEDAGNALDAQGVRDWMISKSLDLGDVGKDNKYGDGLPKLDATWGEENDTDTDTDTDTDADTEPDTDTDADTDPDTDTDTDTDTDAEDPAGCGCATGGAAPAWPGLLLLLAMRRRSR